MRTYWSSRQDVPIGVLMHESYRGNTCLRLDWIWGLIHGEEFRADAVSLLQTHGLGSSKPKRKTYYCFAKLHVIKLSYKHLSYICRFSLGQRTFSLCWAAVYTGTHNWSSAKSECLLNVQDIYTKPPRLRKHHWREGKRIERCEVLSLGHDWATVPMTPCSCHYVHNIRSGHQPTPH